MTRRILYVEPVSRLAVWARRLALFGLLVTILAVIIIRSGMLEFRPAVAAFGGAMAIVALAILLALLSFIPIWRTGARGLGRSVAALAIGAVILAYPAYLAASSYQLPAIYDVTTDTDDPPRFEVITRVRPREANPTDYPGAAVASLQHAAYSDIEPSTIETTPQAAYEAALSVINKRRWRVLNERPPQANRREGVIEAVALTPVMNFRDDVVIRIRAVPDGTRIDVRSASRYSSRDFGANAARIRSLLEDIDDALATKPVPSPPAALPPAKPAQADKR